MAENPSKRFLKKLKLLLTEILCYFEELNILGVEELIKKASSCSYIEENHLKAIKTFYQFGKTKKSMDFSLDSLNFNDKISQKIDFVTVKKFKFK